MPNPYDVLGVAKDANPEAIRKAYKALARQYHPDLNKAAGAEARFKEINAAYDTLGDADKRKMFDQFGDASTRAGFDPSRAGGFRGGFGPGGPDFDFSGGGDFDPSDIFGSMFGGRVNASRSKRRGRDQQTTLTIEAVQAFLGGEHEFVIPRPNGTTDRLKVRIPAGVSDGKTLKLAGQGLPPPAGGPCGDLLIKLNVPDHPILRRVGDDLEMDVPITILEALRGSAITVPTLTGDVKVTIPPDSNNGTRLRLRGRGIQKPTPGDLYLILRPTVPKSSEAAIKAAEALSETYAGDVRAALTF